MNITSFLKNNLNKIPVGISIGKYLAKLNYSHRPGLSNSYKSALHDIEVCDTTADATKSLIYKKVKIIVEHAYHNTRFYKEYYDKCNFDIEQLNGFEDIQKIPFVTKSILKEFDIKDISCVQPGRSLSNTGGSTGQPFYFYTSPEAFGHEWAHIHTIWKDLDFHSRDLKLNFAGRSSIKDFVDYDLLRHSLLADIYTQFENIERKIIEYQRNNRIKFLHGYPSAIYEFAQYCQHRPKLLGSLRTSLKGVFLTSEYPHNYFREVIERTFNVKTQSFYGHTERCILAYEHTKKFQFDVMQSYGFAEVVDNELVGTSYNGFATPLIRYKTGDLIESYILEDELLKSFTIKEGRNGDFILDKNNKNIPLTGLIFGRHHELFNYVTHLQVFQGEVGKATILYVCDKELPKPVDSLFDVKNVDIDFDFVKLNKVIKTVSGKVLLKVNEF